MVSPPSSPRRPTSNWWAPVATAGELVSLCGGAHPDVVLLELDADGWDAVRLALEVCAMTSARIVGTAAALDRVVARRAHGAGVQVVARDSGVASLLDAVRRVSDPPRGPTPLTEASDPSRPTLTPRERDVLGLLGQGRTTQGVSAVLGISTKTVEHHKARIFAKLGVQNQAHAVALAMQHGILPTGADDVVAR